MSGDCWWSTGSYEPDFEAAFLLAQEAELARGRYGDEGSSIADLWDDPGWREFIEVSGTGSVLDFPRLGPDPEDPDPLGTMQLLTDDEVKAWWASGRPTYAEWIDALVSGQLEYPGRACGRCTVLYRNGEPVEIGYWGVTAD
jgi:hypothetical protein